MARQLLLFDPPERFVAGTVGQPGERQFYLQARDGRRLVSVALEKQQVQALADRVETMLDTIMRRTGGEAAIPATAPVGTDDLDPLDAPVVEEFRVGAMAIGWNPETELLVIEAHEMVEDEDTVPELEEDPDDGPTCLRVRLTGAQARAFVKRAMSVVAAGRPPCPFCTQPLEPGGHICPRSNGYRR